MPGLSSGGDSSSSSPSRFLNSTSFMGLKLYDVILLVAAVLVCGFAAILLCFYRSRRTKQGSRVLLKQSSGIIPLVSKDIKTLDYGGGKKMGDILRGEKIEEVGVLVEDLGGKGEAKGKGSGVSSASSSAEAASVVSVEVQNIGWGQWYGLKELEAATRGFSEENVIGEGGYGIVYRGVLEDGSVVAVKNLLNNKGQAQKEFEVEVEAIGRVRHKNLVGLIGYCAEGPKRMLVYEYVDNGNLEQWLHGEIDGVSPLTWDIRMKIAIGTAKGLAYLHEGLEPKVVHRDVKSSNILLDRSWKAKVSDFGLAKLLGSEASYVTTRVMGTFGYVSPEYASTGMLSEGSDVYSFGVLLMELITGRCPVDYSRPPGEINLVDWFKNMVANRQSEDVLDPRIVDKPSPRALKRVMLVCLRCIDMDTYKRPKMGQIVHMLEADEFPFRSEHRAARETGPPLPRYTQDTNKMQLPPKEVAVGDDGDVQRPIRWRR